MKRINYSIQENNVIIVFFDKVNKTSIHAIGAYNINTELVEIYHNRGDKIIIDYLESKSYPISQIKHNIRWWYK